MFLRVRPEVFDKLVTPELLSAYLARPDNLIFLALESNEVVGQCTATIQIHPDKPPELYVSEIGVTPAARRQGVARRLLAAVLRSAKGLGCRSAWTVVNQENDAARRLFSDGASDAEPVVLYETEF